MPSAFIRPRQLCAWKGSSLLIVDERGECGGGDSLTGYYFRETRFLRGVKLEVNGEPPWLCESASLEPSVLTFTYLHPELIEFGGGGSGQSDDGETCGPDGIPHRTLCLRAEYRLGVGRFSLALTVTNHSLRTIEADIGWRLDADFADIQEAHAGERQQKSDVRSHPGIDMLAFVYQDPRLRYQTTIALTGPVEWQIGNASVKTHVRLESQQSIVLGLETTPSDVERNVPIDNADAREQYLTRWRDGFARVDIPSNRHAEQIVRSNVADFASFPLLEGAQDEWLTLQAGIPLYPALFGRDALTAGWQAAFIDRGQALQANLTRLGRLQSDRVYAWRDEEPGRLPQQVRRGPLALLDLNPQASYYADFAAPFMFVIALAHLYSWTGERESIARHWDTARRILDWAETYGDRDRDGYLEYQTRSSKGTKHQGWKDSGNAILYDDGTPVAAPIATCELQGYWYAAQQLMAIMSAAMGQPGDAKAHWRGAADLKERFNRDWWDDDEGSVVLALDPEKQQVRAVTSNAGHCLATGIINDEHLPRTVGRLFAPDLFSGWGIRTLSSMHRAYNPLSYHLGSVWPVEQATIAFGLHRFGFSARALELVQAMFELAALYPQSRIPECVGGYPRAESQAPGAYPRANAPQLWNASAFPLLMHTVLGFQPVGPLETLVVDPVLPSWMPEVIVHDIRLAGSKATLRFWRDDNGSSHVDVLRKRGTLRVVRQPPPESLTTGVFERLGAAFDTVLH